MTLQEIERRNPEWAPWLDAVRDVLKEVQNRDWDAAVPVVSFKESGEPLLARAGIDASQCEIPLLHACRRRWAEAVAPGWAQGYCPVCGAWPGFAEICGVERTRFLRCVRCGAAWRAHGLACAYCANTDHETLGSLVPAEGPPKWALEVCNRCRGYLKTFTRLTVGAPELTLVEDLGSVELDLAAESRGYKRPPAKAHGAA